MIVHPKLLERIRRTHGKQLMDAYFRHLSGMPAPFDALLHGWEWLGLHSNIDLKALLARPEMVRTTTDGPLEVTIFADIPNPSHEGKYPYFHMRVSGVPEKVVPLGRPWTIDQLTRAYFAATTSTDDDTNTDQLLFAIGVMESLAPRTIVTQPPVVGEDGIYRVSFHYQEPARDEADIVSLKIDIIIDRPVITRFWQDLEQYTTTLTDEDSAS